MIKKLGLILIGLNLWAVPPCENTNEEICIYYWRGGGMSSEIRIANMSKEKVLIQSAVASLDHEIISVSNLTIEANKDILIKTIRYDNPTKEKKPIFRKMIFMYQKVK